MQQCHQMRFGTEAHSEGSNLHINVGMLNIQNQNEYELQDSGLAFFMEVTMNKKQNLIKLHLITGETVETVEEVISHERSDIISQYENPRSKTIKIAVKDGNNLGIATIPIDHILYIDVIFLKEDELRDYMEASF